MQSNCQLAQSANATLNLACPHLTMPTARDRRLTQGIALVPVIWLSYSPPALSTPLLRITSREALDRPHQWRVVITAEQPASMESSTSSGPPAARPLGIYTFRVNCASGWLRDVSGASARPARPLNQQRGYPTGVPQAAFAAACGEITRPETLR